jgi:hypothetical protein
MASMMAYSTVVGPCSSPKKTLIALVFDFMSHL